jgi:hypothetical protein
MDVNTFLSKLAAMSRFPEPLLEYARDVGTRLDDAKRAELMKTMEEEYKGYLIADDKRVKRQIEMTDEIVEFKKKNLPKLQQAAEAAEHEHAEHSFDAECEKCAEEQKKNPKKKK